MFNFLKRKPKEKAVIAIDIGAEIVKAVLFIIEEKTNVNGEVTGKRAIIRGYGRVQQKTGDIQSGMMTDIASVIRNCQQAIRQAEQEAGIEAEQMVMGIAGEFIKGATSTFAHKREEDETKINLTELRNVIHKLQWRAFAEVRKKLSEETGYSEIDVKLVSTTIVDMRIDGYKVTNPLGFQGKEITISIFNAFAPLVHISALQNIANELNLELLGIISEPYAIARGMDAGEDGGISAIFIDVGGSTTDIAITSGGAVTGTKMFAIGGRTFTKRLAVELNISLQEAEKLKIAYTANKLDQKSKKIIEDIIAGDIEIWLEGVILALSEFRHTETLPSKIMLCGGGTLLPEIKDALNNEKWYKKLHFARAPQAVFIAPNQLPNIIDETKKMKDQKDITPMALVSVGMELAGEETLVQKALRKVIGIMKV